MKKIVHFFSENILFVFTLFLLAFIPLYPKLPIIDIQNTWVYIRAEDFLVVLVIALWLFLFFRKKISIKTPLTMPILIFWIIGGIATLHGVLLIFPTISNVFSNVAFLSLLRRIEYMSLFFIAYSGMKDKKFISHVAVLLSFVLMGVVGYGFGQKYLGFPAYLTMNEEFAKGIPIRLSQLSRVPSTFGGQYDLAAYLVLIIPITVSLVFGFKNLLAKALLLIASALGFALLFMTVSRVSVVVLLVALLMLLIIQKKKLVLLSLGVLTIFFLIFFPSLLQRFNSTVTEVDVLLDARTGVTIGQVKKVQKEYFKDKVVVKQAVGDRDPLIASSSAIVAYANLPEEAALIVIPSNSNGESLPQGSSYINLPLSPVRETLKEFFQERPNQPSTTSARISYFDGEFIIKKAKAYDLSFTTRTQGEWPRTIAAFNRNILLGSGYGSVSLAVDNDYLRILGESGILGFISFASIFLIVGISIKKVLPRVDDPVAKSFMVGFAAGTVGLALNAVLIDVFEASKVAFVYWMLTGVVMGLVNLYKDKDLDILEEIKKIIISKLAIVIYLFLLTFILYSQTTSNYFVGDDFTWLRWAADCGSCSSLSTLTHYFIQSDGFFYRPGTKVYFDLMYSFFWLNQTIYHFVSLSLAFATLVLIFMLGIKVLKSVFLSVSAAVLFLILSGPSELILWTSGTGHLFNAVFILLSLVLYALWKEKKKSIYLVLTVLSLFIATLFHELGVVAPLLLVLYDVVFIEKSLRNALMQKRTYLILFSPLLPYFILRLFSNSHWFNGDYSYNILKLPFNTIGNSIGYFTLALLGPSSLPLFEKLRSISKVHFFITALIMICIVIGSIKLYQVLMAKLSQDDKRVIVFGLLFFIIALLPFLGLGNITARYSYLASFGFVLILIVFLRKMYEHLLINGRQIAVSVVIFVVILFSSLQLFQLQKLQADWAGAGLKAQNFLSSINYTYARYPKEETETLYFVNVPIRNGDAWLFPVGLSDAVWLVFQDKDMIIYQVGSPEEAFSIKGTNLGRVLQFNENGSLTELTKIKTGEIVPVKP